MKFILSFLLFFSISISAQTFDESGDIQSIAFFNNEVGIFAGTYIDWGLNDHIGVIFKTTNGGEEWIKKEAIDFGIMFTEIFLFGNGIAYTGIETYAGVGGGAVLKSTDYGETWDSTGLVILDPWERVRSICFLDENNGWAATTYNIYNTSDGGSEWEQKIHQIEHIFIYDIYFVNDSTGFVSGLKFYLDETYLKTNIILKTRDTGSSWEIVFEKEIEYRAIVDMDFNSQGIGIAVGGFGYYLEVPGFILKTEDMGETWEYSEVVVSYPDYRVTFENIVFLNDSTAFTAGNGIVGTTDLGDSWEVYRPYTTFKEIYFFDQNTGWAVGKNNLLKTTDGGVTWNEEILTHFENEIELKHDFKLSQNYPNPFNPATKIKFSLPNAGDENFRPLQTQLIVYDALGREIKTLLNKSMQPGEYEIEFDATGLPSGVYFYRLLAGKFSQSRKMVIIR
ncbi:hypothetical protein ASZ90_004229 [hydrocarbon metagenome]|uniref:Secretion system C-terminal sorting domain-containing protein n=1 Tax=hydrocarbon metagenome TaxID=938273 RepID=A0A0W8FYS1_9ZZZZ